MALIASPVLGGQVIQRVPGFTRAVFSASSVDPERTWSAAELDEYVAQWSEPDRAAACVAIYRSFLTRELRELASGAFRERRMEMPALLFCGVADPVVRPDALRRLRGERPEHAPRGRPGRRPLAARGGPGGAARGACSSSSRTTTPVRCS